MKAITLWQPWASLIQHGFKTIETRGHDHFKWLKGQRIAIHAGKRMDEADALEMILDCAGPRIDGERLDEDALARMVRRAPLGAVVCTALVKDARWLTETDSRAACADCDETRFGLVLDEVEEIIPPVVCAGHQGVWEWEGGKV